MSNTILAWCIYCKEPIYAGEPFAVRDKNKYHASETLEHDNCFQLVIESEEE